jgi:predicted PurR-regulated permease PerM
LVPLCWAVIIGVSTFPLQRKFCERIHNRRTLAASIITPAVILVIVLPFIGITFLIGKEASQIYNYYFESTNTSSKMMLENIQRHPFIESLLMKIQSVLGPFEIDLNAYFLPAIKGIASYLLSYSTEIIKNFFAIFLKLILMVITLFFIYRDGESFSREFWSVIPMGDANKAILIHTVKRVISAVIYGIFMTCLVQGFLGGIGFWFTGLPSPIFFGAMMAASALIPIVGTAIIWVPGALYLLIQGEILKGIFLIVWGALVVSSIDNFIRPFFISGKAQLPILVILLGVLGGLFSFGFVGIVIGPIVLALFIDFFDIYKKKFVLFTDQQK